ncbi:hypothetical protein M409DRAFT_27765 [Zasmidium cellare ATCC 36951]|uniref:Uncharacterized protein n=1 Tax=Zasmidium cellare ATCC 36951 TaxID=1080233 RepID=A0A6A6C627_ZASCE|nr:uncharacterized protein M409DRAFT_27765 [Zasmidium cellare ATCC 36951]KAF2161708.1 hypothetical protein M409DRAFT_27765 [Zasmidium cellare ATCC 36951]
MPTILSIPPRHPARLLGTKFDDVATQATNLASEQLDLWEHATVLYHGFDWQTSAETFLYLSRTISRNLESTLCLLNSAMVFARLGDYATASQILDEAEPNERTLAFTMFLMGHVEFELGNFEKAHDSLKVALHSLNGSSQRLYDLGLEYVLRAPHIQQSLRVFESKNELVGMLGSLGALPADAVFEAPPRDGAPTVAASRPSTVNSRNSMDSGEMPTLTDDGSASELGSPIESVRSLEYASDGMQWHGLPDDSDVQVTPPTRTTSKAKGKEPATLLDHSTADNTTEARSSPFAKVLPGLPKTHRSTYEPREARVQGDSVRGLADFIRTLPSQNKTLQPKEAKVQDDDNILSLADFLRNSGPGEASAQPTRDDASDGSVYSNDSNADSIDSDALRKMVEQHDSSLKPRGVEPPPPRHPYRSGVGSMLLHESQRRTANGETNEPFEATPLSSDALHDLLGDDHTSMDWPLTDTASRSLRESFASAVSSRTELPLSRTMNRADMPEPLRIRDDSRPAVNPTIPARRSSLFRRQPSSQAARPSSTVSSSRFFSHVANLK